MELALATDGRIASLRIVGRVAMTETSMLTDYLRVARDNGAVRCILDFASCSEAPTTIFSVLMREAELFREAGGALILSGVRGEQNPFLAQSVESGRFPHYHSLEEAERVERARAGDETVDRVG